MRFDRETYAVEIRLLSNNETAERRVILLIWSITLVLPFLYVRGCENMLFVLFQFVLKNDRRMLFGQIDGEPCAALANASVVEIFVGIDGTLLHSKEVNVNCCER